MKSCFRSVLCCLVAMPFLTGAAPVQPVRRQTAPPSTPKNTLSNYDFPDPTIINVDNVWYAFASQSGFNNTHKHIRMAKSSDFSNWELIESDGLPVDALPNLPTWATDSGNTWAPMVFRNVRSCILIVLTCADIYRATPLACTLLSPPRVRTASVLQQALR